MIGVTAVLQRLHKRLLKCQDLLRSRKASADLLRILRGSSQECRVMMLATVPTTPIWSANVAIVMILANVGAVLLWKSAISLINAWLGAIGYEARAVLSVPSDAAIFTLPVVNITLPELLAATSFGHLIGAGIILGLGRLGAL